MIDRFWEGETVDGQPVSKVKYRTNFEFRVSGFGLGVQGYGSNTGLLA